MTLSFRCNFSSIILLLLTVVFKFFGLFFLSDNTKMTKRKD